MIGVLIKDGASIIAKEIYAGDDEESMKIITEKSGGSNLVFEVYRDNSPEWKTVFEVANVIPPKSTEQTEWEIEKAKGANAAIAFIAKKLGLE